MECYDCKIKFATMTGYKGHMDRVHPEKNYAKVEGPIKVEPGDVLECEGRQYMVFVNRSKLDTNHRATADLKPWHPDRGKRD